VDKLREEERAKTRAMTRMTQYQDDWAAHKIDRTILTKEGKPRSGISADGLEKAYQVLDEYGL
jgi:hypothetical protein